MQSVWPGDVLLEARVVLANGGVSGQLLLLLLLLLAGAVGLRREERRGEEGARTLSQRPSSTLSSSLSWAEAGGGAGVGRRVLQKSMLAARGRGRLEDMGRSGEAGGGRW